MLALRTLKGSQIGMGGTRFDLKRISKKVSRAIDLLVTGECKTIKDAAKKAGLARESLSRSLSTVRVAEHLRMKVLKSLAMAAARAGAVKVDLLVRFANPTRVLAA